MLSMTIFPRNKRNCRLMFDTTSDSRTRPFPNILIEDSEIALRSHGYMVSPYGMRVCHMVIHTDYKKPKSVP